MTGEVTEAFPLVAEARRNLRAEHLVASIEETARSDARVTFLPSREEVTVGELWDRGGRAAAYLDDRFGPGSTVATLLDSSPAAVGLVLGAMRSGRRLVSLPLPPRGTAPEAYQSFAERACQSAGARTLVVPDAFLPILPDDLAIPAVGHVTVEAKGSFREQPGSAELVQFSSGSTGDPKGVLLSLGAIGTNVEAVLSQLELQAGDGVCSWVPLSHDMGLIGILFSSLVAGGRIGGGDMVLIQPDFFVQRPETWLQACSEFSSTITASPNFGFAHAIRRAEQCRTSDLSDLRVCITGAEPVNADTLRSFASTFAAAGLHSRSLCPAYGLAEAGLAVTVTPPNAEWASVVVDPVALAEGRIEESANGTEVVAIGDVLPGFEMLIDAKRACCGPVAVRGASLFDGYLTDDGREPTGGPDQDGWFSPNDVGFEFEGQRFIGGRSDDVVFAAGRNLFLNDVETAAARLGDLPLHHVQAARFEDGFAVACEADQLQAPEASSIATAVSRGIGVRPRKVIVVARGSLPRTASGKPRRSELARLLESGDLEPQDEHPQSGHSSS